MEIKNKHLIGMGFILFGITFFFGEIFNYNVEIPINTLLISLFLLFSLDLLKGDKER